MPFDFTPNIKPFLAASLLESLTAVRPETRRPSTTYTQGTRAVNGGNLYIAIQSGTSNAGPGPTATSGTQFDGSVNWLALGPAVVHQGSLNANVYMSIGKQTEWSNPATPPAPATDADALEQAKRDATCFLRLNSANFRLGIAKNAWTSGTAYSQYDPTIEQSDYPTPHFVIVDETFIYKCLDNNGGANSTVQPIGTGTAVIELADGYIWKYVGTISNKELYEFGTSVYSPIPLTGVSTAEAFGSISTFTNLVSGDTPFDELDEIVTQIVGDGTGGSAAVRTTTAGGQTTITGMFASSAGQNYSEAFALAYREGAEGAGAVLEAEVAAGALDTITVTSPGDDYVDAIVVIIGDGTGAEAEPVISGNQVTAVNITTPGTDYTWARAFVLPGTAGSVAQAVLAPGAGHGSNLAGELGASTILISSILSSSLSDYIPVDAGAIDGSFRQIGLVSSVRAQPSSSRNAEAYLGPSHPSYDAAVSLDKYLEDSGHVIYLNNIVAITHTSQQEEIIKISITL